MRILGACSKIR
uniref:Uncharacterized protein n=1 Tax=Arundo donax TaxID=35708 RepID=A0A0A9CEK4_ARUDO